jgi:hypothetical protein
VCSCAFAPPPPPGPRVTPPSANCRYISSEVDAVVEEDEPGLRERAPEVAAFVAHYFDRLKEASKLFRSRHMMTALSLFDQVWFGTHSFGFF